MSVTRYSYEPEPPQGEWFSDEPPMESYQHLMQMLALIATLRWHWRGRSDYFVGGNLTVYFSPQQRKSEDFRGPDFFVVLDVDGTRPRRSWVVWEEGGKYPNVIVELLSESTEANDRGEKLRIYQDVFRTPEYYLFDPHSGALEGFRLAGGEYQPIVPDAEGRLACDQLALKVGVVDGELRFFTRDGVLVEKPEEAADGERLRADEEHRRAIDARRAADEARRQADEARRQADDEQRRAHEAQQRAAEAQRRADEERLRAERAEAALAALRKKPS